MTTSIASDRYDVIRSILEDLASKPFSFGAINAIIAKPVLRNSAIISSELLARSIWAIKRREITPTETARFLSIVYTVEDVDAFINAYDEFAPNCYNQDEDLKISTPWCMPWLATVKCVIGAEETDTPESLGKKAALADCADIRFIYGKRK